MLLRIGDAGRRLCLEAVRHHHATGPGPLATRTVGQRLARLLQRADKFAAHLSPRSSRRPDSASAAMQAVYFDEDRAIDEAGAALIKAVGVYSPGSLVRLANQEIGVVVRRGANTTMPRVAILVNRDGIPTGEHPVRDTSQREFRITGSVRSQRLQGPDPAGPHAGPDRRSAAVKPRLVRPAIPRPARRVRAQVPCGIC